MTVAIEVERTAAIDEQAAANRKHRARLELTAAQIDRVVARPLSIRQFYGQTTALCRADPFDVVPDYFVRAAQRKA